VKAAEAILGEVIGVLAEKGVKHGEKVVTKALVRAFTKRGK